VIDVLSLFFLISAIIILAYAVRHYVFGFKVLTSENNCSLEKMLAFYNPTVTIIVPAYKEERVIGRLLGRLVELEYPKDLLQVIVVNDGHGKDGGRSAEIIEAYSIKYPWIMAIHRLNGGAGKARALNEALDYATGEITVFFDADYLPNRDIIQRFVPYFQDPLCGAVQGYIYVLPAKGIIPAIVRLERIGGYRVDQLAREKLGLMPQLGGTAMACRTSLLKSLGGFDPEVLAEDTDLTFRIFESSGFKVRYCEHAVAGEEAPTTLLPFWNQRHRWAYGHFQCAFKHWLSLSKDENLNIWEKIDGLFCLGIYLLPILIGLNWILTLMLLILGKPILPSNFSMLLMSLLYFAFAGFGAPFAAFCGCLAEDNLGPLKSIFGLVLCYFLNVFICTKAFLDLIYCSVRRKQLAWRHTPHGN